MGIERGPILKNKKAFKNEEIQGVDTFANDFKIVQRAVMTCVLNMLTNGRANRSIDFTTTFINTKVLQTTDLKIPGSFSIVSSTTATTRIIINNIRAH